MNDQSNTADSSCTQSQLKALPIALAEPQDGHVQWLADWHKVRDAACEAPDASREQAELWDKANALSIKLAITPATSLESLIAQLEWFKEDLGIFVLNNASPEHGLIFDTLIKSVLTIDA